MYLAIILKDIGGNNMALLTNEQIAELTRLHDEWWDGNGSFQEYLSEWNKKQTGIQVNVNWDKYTKKSQYAALRLHFITVDNGSKLWSDVKETILIARPKPIITPHPHAEMIAKYAEVAQRRVDPWVEFEWTFGVSSDYWQNCDKFIGFSTDKHYRHIGETK